MPKVGPGRRRTRCESCRNPEAKRPKRACKPCLECGELIGPFAQSVLAQYKYCGRECMGKANRKSEARACLRCGAEFWRKLGGSDLRKGVEPIFCSRACRWGQHRADMDARQQREQEARERVQRFQLLQRLARKLAKLAEVRAPRTCSCKSCGVAYEQAKYGRTDVCTACREAQRRRSRKAANKARRRTASAKASKLAYKSRRRARQRIDSENIKPHEVFARDRWRCQLCGDKTPEKLRGTCEDKAPELDHVVSLADGGSHTWGNVQCACRACNQRKGARSLGQLSLAL